MVRIASAVLLLTLVAGTIWWLPWWATLLLAVGAAAMGGRELSGLAAHAGTPVSPGFLGLASGAAALMTAVSGRTEIGLSSDGLPALLLVTMIAIGLIALVSGPPSPMTLTQLGILCLAPLYVGMPLGAIARAHATLGPAAITWLVGVVATSDTAQYYTGRLLGIRKLAPVVSPGKTLEGAVAGAAMASWGLIDLQPVTGALLALLLAGFGLCGDLFESLLKRSAGVKDSAALIPGHGGVLDRLDSYLFAGPVFYLFVRFVA
jgi:phosphatidate cytidylyltransferase